MSGNLRLQFVLEAIDNATKTMRRVNEATDKLNEPMRRVKTAAREMFSEAGGARLAQQMDVINGRAASLVGTVRGVVLGFGAATAAAGGMFFMLKNPIDVVADVADTAEKVGIGTEALSRLQFAAEQAGSNAEEMAESVRFLGKNMIEARNGSKEMQQQFALVGITAKMLKTMKVTDVVDRIAATYSAVGDAGQNAQIKISNSQALMGRGGAKLIQTFNGGVESLREMAAESDRIGYTVTANQARGMKAYNDTFNKLQASIRGVMVIIASAALPALTRMTDRLIELNVSGRGEWADKLGRSVGDLVENLPGFLTVIGQFGQVMVRVGSAVASVAEALGGWRNVMTLIGVLLGAVVIVKVIALGVAIYQAVPIVWGLVTAFWAFAGGLLAVVGLPALIAVGLVAAAALIYSKWEPISQFFSNIWEKIKAIGSATANGISGFFGGGQSTAASSVPTQAPSALADNRSKLDGKIRIFIDSEGRPQVRDISSQQSGRSNIDIAYQGPGMAFAP